eukprot:CAMPEP_0176448858 /NCGR_PEP_ID=MMETSP0127-20121128/26079_1 /TAXON_ID=938130 /ORGANISM="Platyophrya macrostoma, Strain WH" /LENGTH=141 /DNA_ID=CAMNT_0017835979 /DNA_START=20 /DNA_END=441 /DNA_ORIENTATION=+
MDRRSTRSMRTASQEDIQEPSSSKKGGNTPEPKSTTEKKNPRSPKVQSQGSQEHEKAATSGTKHDKSPEQRSTRKGSEHTPKGKHDKDDNEEAKGRSSARKVISSKFTPQLKKNLDVSDSKKKVKPSAQSPAVFLEIRSST